MHADDEAMVASSSVGHPFTLTRTESDELADRQSLILRNMDRHLVGYAIIRILLLYQITYSVLHRH